MRLFLASLVTMMAVSGQTPTLPPDVDPKSYSRFPPVVRAELKTDQERAAFDFVAGANSGSVPLMGPGGVSMYSPGSAQPIQRLNQYLRNESTVKGKLFELCALIGAWEIDQQYEWSAHEPAALREGASQKTIDVIKYNRPIEGLDEQDTDRKSVV